MAEQETESSRQLRSVTDTEKPRDDTNVPVVNRENNIAKEDLDDNITKPAAPTNEETEDDTNEPANKEPTVQADDKREDLTEKNAPDATSSPALDPVNGDQLHGFTGGSYVHPQQDQDEPKDDTNFLHQENNIVKEDSDDNITKPAAPTNEETEDDTNEPANKKPTVQADDKKKPRDDTNVPVVNRENHIVKEDLDDNITKPAAPTNEETEDDTNEPANKEPTVQADDKREDLTEKNAPDTTSSPALDPVKGDQLHGFTGGSDVHPQQDQDEPKDDTNSLHQENNIVKEDSDDNITKPAAPTNEETEDDTNEPANKQPTVQADDKREDLTEKKAPEATSSPAPDAVNGDQSDYTSELTAPADVKREDFTEENIPDTTSPPAPEPVNADQSDGPDVHSHQDEDIQNEAARDHERSQGHDSPEVERLHTKEAEKEMHNQRIPVETIKSVSLESVERTATDDTGILRGNLRVLTAVAVLVVAVLLANHLSVSSPPETPREESKVEVFLRQMEKVKAQFPNQRAELWKRSRIHLLRHLQTAHPTAPVSLILTAGLRAEKTLHCLAQGLASSLSFTLNASYLHIDGSSEASQDSDQVKLDIDRRLQRAFEGDKPVAIIHRFEELPPGSTLIFYRYCDHENAAYKETFLIFTVLLEEEEEIHAKLHLNAVEEMVDDHLKKKFLSHDHPVSFDRMDIDKYGGLWSRISHLTLPVAAEHRIEYRGCQIINHD